MTEEEKNAQAQADKENEENDELKVVVPEANKVTMPAEEVKDQPDYLKVFANLISPSFSLDKSMPSLK